MKPIRIAAIAASAALAFVSGCSSDGPTEQPPLPSGTLAFDFVAADESGRFTASGVAQRSGSLFLDGTWAVGLRIANPRYLVGLAMRQEDGRDDLALILVPEHSTGVYEIDPLCPDEVCPTVEVLFDDGGAGERFCSLTTGTIQVAAAGTRMEGTFSGSGSCTIADGQEAFSITGGTFDVFLLDRSLL